MSSKKQLEQFEAQVNGIRLNLLKAFDVQDRIDKFWPETGRILEVELMTIEGDQAYIIGRYINGRAMLVREKTGKPIKELLTK